MKSRLFIVNDITLKEAINDKIAKIKIPFIDDEDKTTGASRRVARDQFINSVNSMMADMLQLQKGDYIFFWCEKEKSSFKSTITGVYRVISEPYFKFDNEDDIYPFKIMIEEAYTFKKSISEYEVLNSPYIKTPLWNIIGKKTCGKRRGSIQLTPNEASVLLTMLIDKNPKYSFKEENVSRFIELSPETNGLKPLAIDLTRTGNKQNNPEENRLFEYSIYEYVHLTKRRKLHSEKTLEGLFNQDIINNGGGLLSQIGIKEKIIWFGNYLPYSLDKTEMDYLIVCSRDGVNPSSAFVVEFKKGNLNKIDSDTHFHRAMLYSKWVNENLFNGSSITRPVIICETCPIFSQPANQKEKEVVDYYKKFEQRHKWYNVLPVKIYTVKFPEDSDPIFTSKK